MNARYAPGYELEGEASVPMDGASDSIPDGAVELDALAPPLVTSPQARTAVADADIDAEPDSVAVGDSDSSSEAVADGDSDAEDDPGAFSTIAYGDASRLLVVVATVVIDAPLASGVRVKGGPVTADGEALAVPLAVSPLLLGEAPPVVMLGAALEPPMDSLGADIDAGAPLDSDPLDSEPLDSEPLVPGEPEAPGIRSVHDPGSRTAAIPSIAPVLTVIWTCVVPSG